MEIQEISKAIEKVVKEMGVGSGKYAYKKNSVNLALAEELSLKVIEEAEKRNMKIVVAVSDASGNPVCVKCMDDSFSASYKIALDKAYTVVALKMSTKVLAKLANPNGGSLYGIQNVDPRIVIFGGGEPLIIDGQVVGGVAVSGGTAEQDTSLGEFAERKFKEIINGNR